MVNPSRRPLLLLLVVMLVPGIGWGCGPSRPGVETSREEATVTGTVYQRGQPAKSGVIVFDPSNVKRRDAAPARAEIGEDGTYSVTTLIGRNIVSIPELNGREGDFLYPNESFEVQSGQANTFDVRIGGEAATEAAAPEEERAGYEG